MSMDEINQSEEDLIKLDPNHTLLVLVRNLVLDDNKEFEQWMLDETGARIKVLDSFERLDGTVDSLFSVRKEDGTKMLDLVGDKRLKELGLDLVWFRKTYQSDKDSYVDPDKMSRYLKVKFELYEY